MPVDKAYPPITELGQLLSEMNLCYWGSQKTGAVIECRSSGYVLLVHYDTGKGHSSAFYSNYFDISDEVFEEAKKKGYVVPKPIMGGVSSYEFVLTSNTYVLRELAPIRDEWERLHREERERVHVLVESIPDRYRGPRFIEACNPKGKAQLAFAEQWATVGKEVADKLLSKPEQRKYRSRASALPVNDREREVAECAMAAFAQWLGTKEGMVFYMNAFEKTNSKDSLQVDASDS